MLYCITVIDMLLNCSFHRTKIDLKRKLCSCVAQLSCGAQKCVLILGKFLYVVHFSFVRPAVLCVVYVQ